MSKSRIVLPIEAMSCASCAATVQEALQGVGGVSTAAVNYATARAAVEYDDAQTNVGQLVRTVREAGYNCGKATVTFAVEDLHYAPSVAPLEKELRRDAGLVHVAAHHATAQGAVDDVPGAVHPDTLEPAGPGAGV